MPGPSSLIYSIVRFLNWHFICSIYMRRTDRLQIYKLRLLMPTEWDLSRQKSQRRKEKASPSISWEITCVTVIFCVLQTAIVHHFPISWLTLNQDSRGSKDHTKAVFESGKIPSSHHTEKPRVHPQSCKPTRYWMWSVAVRRASEWQSVSLSRPDSKSRESEMNSSEKTCSPPNNTIVWV